MRAIFALFAEQGSLVRTLAEVQRRGWRLKSWPRKTGEFRMGGAFTLMALRRLLTNILYTGVIRHKGQIYPGQHAAILAPGVWERVQEQISRDSVVSGGRLRNKHLALLNGLLHCDCCAAPMVYSYAVKKERQYPYCVCRQAQRQGWAACPSKSLPTRVIEEAVLRRLRESQGGRLDASAWDQMDRRQQIGVLQAMVERIGYDGRTRQISICFHLMPVAGQEAGV